ncbi:pentapeptide repeat-containing protein [Streptomyces sp. NBC_01102]|uniref:pentapeptide repeat-containing protein n=1 Tax=Streptomyces sp. NBC_01102 TaxID=2903749 RepID=UPI0038639960
MPAASFFGAARLEGVRFEGVRFEGVRFEAARFPGVRFAPDPAFFVPPPLPDSMGCTSAIPPPAPPWDSFAARTLLSNAAMRSMTWPPPSPSSSSASTLSPAAFAVTSSSTASR